ncbi:MAG: hypothetical protein K5770_16905 [Lachnospiraceae bacterium]|nr:hypothetical protein [Lachnospiraceae bacterium]
MTVLGVDAGGTKTQAFVADEKERILGESLSGPGNHQTSGIETATDSIRQAVEGAIAAAGLSPGQIDRAVLGISGADRKEDFDILIPVVKEILLEIPFKVINDAWLGLRLASERFAGIVSVCGTGAAHAGRSTDGKEYILRNLDYATGNKGGGDELVLDALHYAFRSSEGTWEKSRLEEAIPEVFGVKDLDAVCDIVFNGKMTKEQRYRIPVTVFSLARENDPVSVFLIRKMGTEMGRYAAAVIERLKFYDEKVPATLIGSLFKTEEPLLINSYMEVVRQTAPGIYPVIPKEAPALGAVRLALDKETVPG